MAGLVLKNGFVVTPAGVVPGGIASEDGVITVVAASGSLPKGDPENDVHGSFILPGVIDPHVHLGTGGTADDAKFLSDLASETRSGAAGGVTTIVTDHESAHGVSWVTTKLSRDGVSLLQLAKEAIPSRSPIDVRYTANPCTDDHLDEISNLVEQSVTSFKMFPSYVGAAAEEFGITTRIGRYHNVYGPNGTWDGVRAKAPAAICRKVAEAKMAGTREIEIWGDGEQTRSFMYIDDCVEGTIRITTGDYGDPLNLGSTELVSINQLVDIVETIAGITLRRNYNLAAPQGVRGRNSDNTRLVREIGWEPQISLQDGLERTYRWIHDELVHGRRDVSEAS